MVGRGYEIIRGVGSPRFPSCIAGAKCGVRLPGVGSLWSKLAYVEGVHGCGDETHGHVQRLASGMMLVIT
jgi:hypothetical protein